MKTIVLVVLAAALASQICQAIDNQSPTVEKRDLQSIINQIKDFFHKTNPTIGGNSGRHSNNNEEDSKTEEVRDLQSFFKETYGKVKSLFEKLNPFGGKDTRQMDTVAAKGEEGKEEAEEKKPARQTPPVDEPAKDSKQKAEETKPEKTARQPDTPK